MKYLRQFLLILFISFLGELLKYFLPLPIPASIYGMVILFIGFVPVSVITVVALVAVMGATGRVSQCVIKKSKAKEKAKEQEI